MGEVLVPFDRQDFRQKIAPLSRGARVSLTAIPAFLRCSPSPPPPPLSRSLSFRERRITTRTKACFTPLAFYRKPRRVRTRGTKGGLIPFWLDPRSLPQKVCSSPSHSLSVYFFFFHNQTLDSVPKQARRRYRLRDDKTLWDRLSFAKPQATVYARGVVRPGPYAGS